MPKYPPLARAARVEGVVKLAFTPPENAGKPTNVEVLSGHPMLKGAAADNVKTWIFENRYPVDRRYEATFRYRISGVEVPAPTRDKVTFDSFHDVEVVTDLVKGTIQSSFRPAIAMQAVATKQSTAFMRLVIETHLASERIVARLGIRR